MPNRSKARLVPVIAAIAIMPAALLPLARSSHIPDQLLGGIFGIFIGLAVVALFWMARGGSGCAPRDREG